MSPKLSTFVLGGLVALQGCTGQTMEGAWIGELPFTGAKECRIRLQHDRTFDAGCKGDPAWNGVGNWDVRGNQLILTFQSLGRGESRETKPPVLTFRYVGRGNELDLYHLPGEAKATWVRRMAGR